MQNLPNNAVLIASDRHGVFIPQYFAESIVRDMVTGVSAQDWQELERGPEFEHYWDTWDRVLNNAIVTDDSGQSFYLWQDGDLWAVPTDFIFEEQEN